VEKAGIVSFMKALLLDGSRANESDLEDIKSTFQKELKAKGWDVEAIELKNIDISPCMGCFRCWIKTPGICITDDAARDVSKKFIQSDLVVFLTPVTFGGYSSELKKALDRSLGNMLPYFTKIDGKTHHKKRYKNYPKLIALGTLPASNPKEEKIFKDLVSRNAVNAHAPSYAADVIVTVDDKIQSTIKALLQKVGALA
jgi:multimeric flavodoxin WrbA